MKPKEFAFYPRALPLHCYASRCCVHAPPVSGWCVSAISVLTRSTWVARAYLVVCSRVILRARRFSSESERCLASVGGTGQTGTQPLLEPRLLRVAQSCVARWIRGRVFSARIKILRVWYRSMVQERCCWIVASFHARTFFFSFHFLPLLFSSIPCLPRAQEGVYARGSSNERMQIVATTLSVIFFNAELMPPPDLSVSDHPLLLLPLPQYPRPKLYGIYVNDSY